MKKIGSKIIIIGIITSIWWIYAIFPLRGAYITGEHAIRNSVYSLVLVTGIIFLA